MAGSNGTARCWFAVVSRGPTIGTYALLEVNLRLIKCPADSLEIRADIEEGGRLGMEAGEDSLLANGDTEVCDQHPVAHVTHL